MRLHLPWWCNAPLQRKTKIVCTMGPSCWSEEGLGKLMDAGLDVARFNFSHGDHAAHKEVLDRVRQVAAAKGLHIPCALDTKGPEIRTAMLRGRKDISLNQGEQLGPLGSVRAGAQHAAADPPAEHAPGGDRVRR